MNKPCKGNCGRETNNPTGFCTICVMDGKVPKDTNPLIIKTSRTPSKPIAGTIKKHWLGIAADIAASAADSELERKNEMRVISSKVCIDCGQEYKPTSNVQKRCVSCAATWKIEKCRLYREAKKAQVSPGRAAPLAKSVKHRNTCGGKISEPEDNAVFPEIIMRLREKKAGYLIDIEKINSALTTIKEICGAEIPGMEDIV